MTLHVRRRDGTSFECLSGLRRMRAALHAFGWVRVPDVDRERVRRARGRRTVGRLEHAARDYAETNAAQLIAKAKQQSKYLSPDGTHACRLNQAWMLAQL